VTRDQEQDLDNTKPECSRNPRPVHKTIRSLDCDRSISQYRQMRSS